MHVSLSVRSQAVNSLGDGNAAVDRLDLRAAERHLQLLCALGIEFEEHRQLLSLRLGFARRIRAAIDRGNEPLALKLVRDLERKRGIDGCEEILRSTVRRIYAAMEFTGGPPEEEVEDQEPQEILSNTNNEEDEPLPLASSGYRFFKTRKPSGMKEQFHPIPLDFSLIFDNNEEEIAAVAASILIGVKNIVAASSQAEVSQAGKQQSQGISDEKTDDTGASPLPSADGALPDAVDEMDPLARLAWRVVESVHINPRVCIELHVAHEEGKTHRMGVVLPDSSDIRLAGLPIVRFSGEAFDRLRAHVEDRQLRSSARSIVCVLAILLELKQCNHDDIQKRVRFGRTAVVTSIQWIRRSQYPWRIHETRSGAKNTLLTFRIEDR